MLAPWKTQFVIVHRMRCGSAPPLQVFQKRRDGRVLMRFETTGRKEVIRWVLSWMPDVKVLGPKSLRDRIGEKLEAGLRSQE